MSKIGIVTDSHSGITPKQAVELGVMVLPATFYIDGEEYKEGVNISREEFFQKQDDYAEIHTSQPSIAEIMEIWDEALKRFDEIIYIPLSSGLSGSYNTAMLLSREDDYEGKVYVVDNGRVSVPQYCSILDAINMRDKGYSAEQIKKTLEKYAKEEVIYVAINDIFHLKRGGRINTTAAIAASVLNIKPVVKFDVGTLDIYKKTRGMKRAKREMFAAIKNDLETKFSKWNDCNNYYLMTATAVTEEENEQFIREVQEEFPNIKIYSGLLPLTLCSHIGHGGLGIGISCKPLGV